MVDAETRKLRLAYKNMLDRCYNAKHSSYADYGGRGITVCEEWRNNRSAFIEWAKRNGHALHLSIDRIDVNGGYAPENCRWATMQDQLRNRRCNRIIVHDGEALTLTAWAEKLNIKRDTLSKRLSRMGTDVALQPGPLVVWSHGTRHGYEKYKCKCRACLDAHAEHHRKRRALKKLKEAA